MYNIYFLVSAETNRMYIGMTKNNLNTRLIQHKSSALKGKKSPLYDCMRKHGIDNFIICLRNSFLTKEECCLAEKYWISFGRKNNWNLLNLADGGEGGYIIPEAQKEEWQKKLSIKRHGRKPALGMKHSEENKKFFSECNKRKIPTYPELNPLEIGFTAANKKYGISKTHYYRLLKRAKSNELS
jgi:group I intron endonuclease